MLQSANELASAIEHQISIISHLHRGVGEEAVTRRNCVAKRSDSTQIHGKPIDDLRPMRSSQTSLYSIDPLYLCHYCHTL